MRLNDLAFSTYTNVLHNEMSGGLVHRELNNEGNRCAKAMTDHMGATLKTKHTQKNNINQQNTTTKLTKQRQQKTALTKTT